MREPFVHSELFLFVLIPAGILLLDYVYSLLTIPSLWLYGIRSGREYDEEVIHGEGGDSRNGVNAEGEAPGNGEGGLGEILGPDPGSKVYLFVLQNNEPVPVEWRERPMRIQFSIRSAGTFDKKIPLRVLVGPDQYLALMWRSVGRELICVCRQIRPLKTWSFRLFVSRDVAEVEMRVFVPLRGSLRRFLNKVNWRVFDVSRLLYHEYLVVVREREDKYESVKPFFTNRPLLKAFAVMWFIGMAVYAFCYPYLVPDAGKVPASESILLFDRLTRMLASPTSLLLDGGAFVVAMGIIFWLTRTEAVPVAQGYRVEKDVKWTDIAVRETGSETHPIEEDDEGG